VLFIFIGDVRTGVYLYRRVQVNRGLCAWHPW
jgi:hypothetical protein